MPIVVTVDNGTIGVIKGEVKGNICSIIINYYFLSYVIIFDVIWIILIRFCWLIPLRLKSHTRRLIY